MTETILSQELEWKHVVINVFGLTLRGIRGFEVTKEVDKDHLHAAGSQASGIQSGNEKITGMIKVLKSDYDRMNDVAQASGFDDILDVPWQALTGVFMYRKAFGRPKRTIELIGMSYTSAKEGMSQGDKQMEVELPFLAVRKANK